jgi:UDP-N-acetyl-D-glucosamine dehydrogenase
MQRAVGEGVETMSAKESLTGGSSTQAKAPAADLRERIEKKTALVGVIGLGYVGLPLSLTLAGKGYRVLGFDTDPAKVSALEQGRMYISHLEEARLNEARASKRFVASSDFSRLAEPDVLVICVPTPLGSHREPDMSAVVATGRQIRDRLRPGQLVILESTTYPGTTEELLRGILEESGLRCGSDFFLAYAPEREDPGNKGHATESIPRVVAGVGEIDCDLAQAFYGNVVPSTIRVSSCRTAEATKLTENVFRAVNIALVNELKMIFDRMGIDVWEVLDAAATKPFGFMRFNPGPGWGGHCIPLDPFYLAWKARECGVTARFIEIAGDVNVAMPEWVVGKLQEALNARGKAVRGSRVLLLGLAYKKDIEDPRESPAFEILDGLIRRGAEVSYHDPHVAQAPKMRSWPNLPRLSSVPLSAATLSAQDAVVLVTDHAAVDYDLVARHAPLLVDTRGVFRNAMPNLVKA